MSVQVTGTVGTANAARRSISGSKAACRWRSATASLPRAGRRCKGALNVDIAVSGTAAAPKFSGRVTAEGGGFVDPETGIVLKNLSLVASVSGDQRRHRTAQRAKSGEGNCVGDRRVGLDPNAGFPVDLTLAGAARRATSTGR